MNFIGMRNEIITTEDGGKRIGTVCSILLKAGAKGSEKRTFKKKISCLPIISGKVRHLRISKKSYKRKKRKLTIQWIPLRDFICAEGN